MITLEIGTNQEKQILKEVTTFLEDCQREKKR